METTSSLLSQWQRAVEAEETLKAMGADPEDLRDAHRVVMILWAKLWKANYA